MTAQGTTVVVSHEPSTKNILDEDYEWPFEFSFDIAKSGRPKIAFLSGEERQYYPENPGHSKLGVVTSMNQHKGDTPNPMYTCPPIGVQKPISKKGYGIGGLSASRFPLNLRSLQEKRPEPGTYQKIHMYPARPKQGDVTNPILISQCHVAFGIRASSSRFGTDFTPDGPGPGSYNAQSHGRCAKPKAKESFGGHRCIIPTVVTVCRYVEGEKCHVCGEPQLFDYYRTKRPIIHKTAGSKVGKAAYVIMCRICYCAAWNGHSATWAKHSLEIFFHKVRHCNYKHEHQGLPNRITKSNPAEVAKLTRKEILLAKYYNDSCPPELKMS